ncbi:MAG: NAD(P)H-dependent oxidoreductase [Emcibacter sp.]|nr:NAD(P)H-dependent oxidoreductase [Emcibacter sp.]
MKILTICGSLRRESYNQMLLSSLSQYAPKDWVFKQSISIGELPHYNEDIDTATPPSSVDQFRKEIEEADALYWAMPEFNHSIPGVLKNALDWATHPLNEAALLGRVIAVSVVTQGRGGYRGMSDLSRVLRDLGNFVVPAPELCIQFAHEHISPEENGQVSITDPVTEKLLKIQLQNLEYAVRHRMGHHAGMCWKNFFENMATL